MDKIDKIIKESIDNMLLEMAYGDYNSALTFVNSF